jgi:hypothetical protein
MWGCSTNVVPFLEPGGGGRDGAVGWGTALQTGTSRVRYPMVSLEFFTGPGVDSASNRNEYQESFLEGKGGRCVGLTTLPPSCVDCLKTWEPWPPGVLRACMGLLYLFLEPGYVYSNDVQPAGRMWPPSCICGPRELSNTFCLRTQNRQMKDEIFSTLVDFARIVEFCK